MYHMVIDPRREEDQRLRRFCPLGWIAQKRGEHNWDLTGHALVMDMDRGRDRQPWIVLASKWPNWNGDDPERFTIEAQQRPRRGDENVHGIFPGDRTRTPIAKLRHIEDKNPTSSQSSKQKSTPFLKQFGPNFNFDLSRKGGERYVVSSKRSRDYHPDLARIMGWFWDEGEKEEVCYTETGVEFMRYKPSTGMYRVPYLELVPVAGQLALHGEVIAGPILLAARLGYDPKEDIVPRRRQESTTAGY